uniref:Uncharacterized protein n=1 Tax=Heterorhabditis bacteriophora TaxID=37862 RepID=A0A1I7WIA3_HETBA
MSISSASMLCFAAWPSEWELLYFKDIALNINLKEERKCDSSKIFNKHSISDHF